MKDYVNAIQFTVAADSCYSPPLAFIDEFITLFLFSDFLPRGSGIVTRRPLVLQLLNSKQGTADYYVFIVCC